MLPHANPQGTPRAERYAEVTFEGLTFWWFHEA